MTLCLSSSRLVSGSLPNMQNSLRLQRRSRWRTGSVRYDRKLFVTASLLLTPSAKYRFKTAVPFIISSTQPLRLSSITGNYTNADERYQFADVSLSVKRYFFAYLLSLTGKFANMKDAACLRIYFRSARPKAVLLASKYVVPTRTSACTV